MLKSVPSLKSSERQRKILTLLAKKRRVPFSELEDALSASPATLRRDLAFLESKGDLVRVHGGIMIPDPVLGEISHSDREKQNKKQKDKIADRAVARLGADRRLFIDAGTTCLALARRLIQRDDLTLYTHSVSILSLTPRSRARIIGLGGECRPVTMAMVGTVTLDWLHRFRFDACFIGASALDRQEGLFTTELTECAVKQTALTRSSRRFLLADRSKLKTAATVRFAGWDDIDHWIAER